MAWPREVHGIVLWYFFTINNIAALSYKCFSASWLKDVIGNFVYFDVHLLMPLLVLSEIVC